MKLIFDVNNMKCMGCVSAVQDALEKTDGVSGISVSLEDNSASMETDLPAEQIAQLITGLGYPASLRDG